MDIVLVGVSHATAPVSLRERLSISGTHLEDALTRLRQTNGHGRAPLYEGAILSTCNRLEVYAVAAEAASGHESIVDFLSLDRHLSADEFRASLYCRSGGDAVRHLMRVACGLESMIVGEPQVLGQVTAAYRAALAQRVVGPVLNTLFQRAIRAGKRAHTETNIGQYAVSVPSVAATLAERVTGGLQGKVVLVMGAGEMGELAARTLISRGATGIIVANRTYDRAVVLARQLGGEAMTFERQIEALARADIVITTTDAPHVILTPEKVASALTGRVERPLVIVDIAVPRDTDPAVADIPGVRLYDIDDLQSAASDNLEARQRETPHVERIVDEETCDFMCWFDVLGVVPTITDLRAWAESVKAAELKRALQRLEHLGDHEREVVRSLAHGLVNKLLHAPTVQLKQRAIAGDGHLYAGVVRDLFELGVRDCSVADDGNN
jgi:glutamyl-tRNA reductase